MKKIILITISALATLFVSCDMELLPYSAIEESQGMATFEDAQNYRVSIYSPLMSLLCGARLTIEDTRADYFNAMADFGNTYGLFHSWTVQTTDQSAESLWYGDYSLIGSMNYAIDRFGKILKNAELTDEEKEQMELFIAEAHMTRALAYLDLVTKYCEAYDPERCEEQMGLPLTTEYNPTTSSSKYPGRSNLYDTYDLILSDLEEAANITTTGAVNSPYYTEDVVEAAFARVYLYMQEWDLAYSAAEGLVDGKYTLVNNQAAHDSMWKDDESTENIMLVVMDLNNVGSATGTVYLNDKKNNGVMDPEYIPTKSLLDLYDAKDIRRNTYFKQYTITATGYGTDDLYLFTKFPGNPDLYRLASNYVNMAKPFRIAEQYLIMAECAAMNEELTEGIRCLNKLREARIADYIPATTSTIRNCDELLLEVQKERARELVGEGFRMHDLKRWGLDVTRGASQNPAMVRNGQNYDELDRKFGEDGRYLWPIPKTEIDANPQIKNQQNPDF